MSPRFVDPPIVGALLQPAPDNVVSSPQGWQCQGCGRVLGRLPFPVRPVDLDTMTLAVAYHALCKEG